MVEIPRGRPQSVPDVAGDAYDAAARIWRAAAERAAPILGQVQRGLQDMGEAQRQSVQSERQAAQKVAAGVGGAAKQAVATLPGLSLADRMRLSRAPRATRDIGLRGPLEPDPAAPTSRYYADLTDPAVQPLMTTPSGRPGYAYVDEYPASGLAVRTTVPELQAGVADILAGRPIDMGPHVKYVNDDPSGPTPRQALRAPTAGMVAAAIVDSGLDSVNINSTTGGHKKSDQKNSRHNSAQAVDINRVNELPVGFGSGNHTYPNPDPNAVAAAAALQNAYRRQPNIRENFGPTFQEKTRWQGFRPVHWLGVKGSHQNHVHGSGLE